MFFAAGDQLMLLACSCHLHWQMWAKHLIRPNPLKTHLQIQMKYKYGYKYRCEPNTLYVPTLKNTYTNINTNMNTNTDVGGRPKTLYVPMNGEYVYLSSFLHKNN